MAGPWDWIEQLLEQEAKGGLRLSECLTHPVLVVGRPEDGVLSDAHRTRVWEQWGLPVFEQWRAADGTLLAWECEAHAGFHVTSAYEEQANAGDPCPCGQAGARLVPQSDEAARAAVAAD